MAILKDLLDAYSYIEEHGHPLISTPSIWHEWLAADYEIVIDTDGKLMQVRKLDRRVEITDDNGRKMYVRGDCDSLTPITLYSQCRSSSTAAPRPLSDKVKYLAKPEGDEERKYYEALTALQKAWNEFAGGSTKLEAIMSYLEGGTLRQDILSTGEYDNMPEAKRNAAIYDSSVRFVVAGDVPEEPWEDEDLIRSWDRYMEAVNTDRVIDAVTGEEGIRVHKHGKNILSSDNANGKIISTNTRENTMLNTLGERFTDVSQVPAVTWETSIKAHRMLRWLMNNRSIRIRGKESTTYWTCFSKTEPVLMEFDAVAQETGLAPPSEYGRILKDAIEGKPLNIPEGDVIVMALDYCSPGRIAFVAYHSVSPELFFDGLKKWRERYRCTTSSGYYYPSLYKMVIHAYGRYEKKKGQFFVSDAVRRTQMNRLMQCLLENRDVPEDLERNIVCNVRTTSYLPEVMDEVIGTACAVLNGNGKGRYAMGLDDKNQSRSFLYGRMLAVYEAIENGAIYKKNLGKPQGQKTVRTTNARKLWSAYVSGPEKTEPDLYEKTLVYLDKLSPDSQRYYDALLSEIRMRLDTAPKEGRALRPEYLIGYEKQKKALRDHSRDVRERLKNSKDNKEENNDE